MWATGSLLGVMMAVLLSGGFVPLALVSLSVIALLVLSVEKRSADQKALDCYSPFET